MIGRRAVYVAAACALVLVGGCTKSPTTKNATPQSNQVYLEAVSAPGTSPWTQSVATDADLTSAAVTLDSRTLTRLSADGTTVADGGASGLYGGSQELSVCDASKLVSFLHANPAQATAWKGVVGASDVATYVDTLTPVIVTLDTRVTNHGYENGAATPFQSVMQAGTAIMVDRQGVPRVRCECGNPLAAPAATPEPTQAQVFSGPKWQTFEASQVVTVQPAAAPQPTLEVVPLERNAAGAVVANPDVPKTQVATGGLVGETSGGESAESSSATSSEATSSGATSAEVTSSGVTTSTTAGISSGATVSGSNTDAGTLSHQPPEVVEPETISPRSGAGAPAVGLPESVVGGEIPSTVYTATKPGASAPAS